MLCLMCVHSMEFFLDDNDGNLIIIFCTSCTCMGDMFGCVRNCSWSWRPEFKTYYVFVIYMDASGVEFNSQCHSKSRIYFKSMIWITILIKL